MSFKVNNKPSGPGKALRQENVATKLQDNLKSTNTNENSRQVLRTSSVGPTIHTSIKLPGNNTSSASNTNFTTQSFTKNNVNSAISSPIISASQSSNENKTESNFVSNHTYSSYSLNKDNEEDLIKCEKFKKIISNNPINLGEFDIK